MPPASQAEGAAQFFGGIYDHTLKTLNDGAWPLIELSERDDDRNENTLYDRRYDGSGENNGLPRLKKHS